MEEFIDILSRIEERLATIEELLRHPIVSVTVPEHTEERLAEKTLEVLSRKLRTGGGLVTMSSGGRAL